MRVDELRGFRRDVAATFPHLADGYAGDLTAVPVEQGWFTQHQILRVDALRATGLRVYGARGAGQLVLLSGRLDRLEELVEREPPRGLDVNSVVAYADACDEWTSPYDVRPIRLSSADDLAIRARGPVDSERLAQLGAEIRPPKVARAAGATLVTRYVLAGARLIRRKLTVDARGALRRDDVILATRLPGLARAG